MEEPSIHRRAVQSSQGSSEGIGQNSLTSVLLGDCTKARCNLVQCLIPGNALPDLRMSMCRKRWCWVRKTILFFAGACIPADRAFVGNAPHWIQSTVRRINPIQVLCHLRAQKPTCYRMLWIALDLRSSPVLY